MPEAVGETVMQMDDGIAIRKGWVGLAIGVCLCWSLGGCHIVSWGWKLFVICSVWDSGLIM